MVFTLASDAPGTPLVPNSRPSNHDTIDLSHDGKPYVFTVYIALGFEVVADAPDGSKMVVSEKEGTVDWQLVGIEWS